MFTRSLIILAMMVTDFAGAYAGGGPHLGVAMTADEVAAWDISVFPDGRGLPSGRGSAREGRVIYDTHCASCHGVGGRGATAEELVGRGPLTALVPDKTIGSYWPYATTLFDMIRRSKPMGAPGSLTDDETYAVTAYLLFANSIIEETVELTAVSLPQIVMPNRHGFDRIDAR